MKSIAEEVEEDPQFVLEARTILGISRLDETQAARKPVLSGSLRAQVSNR